MSVKYFSKVGSSEQLTTRVAPTENDWVEMKTYRPLEGDYVATADGEWVLNVPTLADLKLEKLFDIKKAFVIVEEDGYTVSSLGFRIDATKKSLEDVQGLINLISKGFVEAPVMFRDYDNAFHPTTLEQLSTFELEIQAHGVKVYGEKWALESAVEAAETEEALALIDPHSLSGYDWEDTKVEETPVIPEEPKEDLVIETL